MRGALTHKVLALTGRPFASSCSIVGIAAIWQWSGSPRSQPMKARFKRSVSRPVRLRPSMLARDSDARRMDDIGFDAASPQPARKPEAIAASLKGNCYARDRAAFVASSLQGCSNRSNDCSSALSFFGGCRSIPGTIPATSQLAKDISKTQT
jgi:hypothetical protein